MSKQIKKMPTFIRQEENTKFVAWGKKNARKDSYVVETGDVLEAIVLNIKDSQLYKKIYEVQPVGDNQPKLILTGKTSLNDEMGYGTKAVQKVVIGDLVQIKFVGMQKTRTGKDRYVFEVAVARK